MSTPPNLRELLELVAQSYEPPVDGPDRVLAQTGHPAQAASVSAGRRRWLTSLRRPAMTALVAMLVVGVAFGLIAGLRAGVGNQSSSSSMARGLTAPAVAPPAGGPAPAGGATNLTGGGKAGSAAPVPRPPARVVQTAQLALQVPPGKVPAALDRLANIPTGLGGYVAESRSDEGVAPATGTITLRVPVTAYPTASAQARAVGHVTGGSSQAQDVTGQYVDLGARISALQQTRATYLTLLSKANSIGDTLAVQQQIQDVQTQIEQLQGQQKLLADTSDLATIAVTVSETGGVRSGPPSTSGFGSAFHHAVSGFTTGLKALIAISGPLLFGLLIVAFVVLLARGLYRTLRRRYL